MRYSKNTWAQIKGIHVERLVKALKADGWVRGECKGAVHPYRSRDGKIITIHWHPKKTFQPSLLKALLEKIGWSERDLKRLKLIK